MIEINNEVFSKENNSAKDNSKKRKIQQENIEDFAEKLRKKHLNLNEEEIKKFLIFQEFISIANEEKSSLEEGGDSVDGAVSILLIPALQISEGWKDFHKGDIDSLELPKIKKKSLKNLKLF